MAKGESDAGKAANKSGKQKKKKWSKGKVREKLANAVLIDKPTYEKLLTEIAKSKLITASIISDRLKVNGSLARQCIRELKAKGLIRMVGDHHHAQMIYTRFTNA
eukprot:GILK01000057.1.p1 GENE.GILK01000057.1~~GILK01000057.1.p1  ORF type:complete len:115 (+),score=22.80 GILK01000057.1:31-345(+)